jgi:hypothetical protein
MPLAYIVLLSIAALAVSSVGAFFSVTGLAKLFAGAPLAVMFMATSLEFAKIVAAAFLHRTWDDLGRILKFYLTSAVVVLVSITSMGIFGYLSHAYQSTSENLKKAEIKLISLDIAGQDIQKELQRMQTLMALIPTTRVSKRIAEQKELEPKIQELNEKALKVKEDQRDLNMQRLTMQTEIGPLVYLAQASGREPDVVAKWFILLFVSVFDPLAICLVISTSFAVKMRAQAQAKALLDAEARRLAEVHANETLIKLRAEPVITPLEKVIVAQEAERLAAAKELANAGKVTNLNAPEAAARAVADPTVTLTPKRADVA